MNVMFALQTVIFGSYLIAHGFFSVYNMCVDTLFLCFCELMFTDCSLSTDRLHISTFDHLTPFVPHPYSGGPGASRWISTEAVLYVQKPHEDPQQIQQSSKNRSKEEMKNISPPEFMNPNKQSHIISGYNCFFSFQHSIFFRIRLLKTNLLILHFLSYCVCEYVVLITVHMRKLSVRGR